MVPNRPRKRLVARPETARACLLIADAVVDDDGGEGEATEVGQGVFDAPMDVKQRVWPLAAS